MTNYEAFCKLVSDKRGKKDPLSVDEIKEVIKAIRTQLIKAGVDIYRVIDSTPKKIFVADSHKARKLDA